MNYRQYTLLINVDDGKYGVLEVGSFVRLSKSLKLDRESVNGNGGKSYDSLLDS